MTKDASKAFATRAALLILLAAILVPYWKLTTMQGYVITDDVFTSDIMNESFPYREYLGAALKAGEAPIWLPHIYGGIPLLARAEAGVCYPFNLILFGLFPPYFALNVVILLTLWTAAVGMFLYAREIGTRIPGALVSAVGFSYSGFMISHIKHLSTIGTVCWYPLGLLVIERAFRRNEPKSLLWLAVIIGLQNLSGHIQTAYYSMLAYLVYFLGRLWRMRREGSPPSTRQSAEGGAQRTWVKPLPASVLWFLAGSLLGMMISAVQLIPTYELVQLTQRSGGVSFQYAASYAYDPANWMTFLYPAANGEISNATYRGQSIFWEDYGYVGLTTLMLGLVAITSMRRTWQVKVHVLIALGAYLLVLGPNTPLYRLVFHVVPGMAYFRFPTRFLFVVDASLCVLAALGTDRLIGLIGIPARRAARFFGAHLAEIILVGFVLADLLYFQLRQNAIVDSEAWRDPPKIVETLKQDRALYRIYSPGGKETHKSAFMAAKGWEESLQPYIDQREFLQASSNILYDIQSADGYAQLTPSSIVDVWGDQNRSGLIMKTASVSQGAFVPLPSFVTIMNMCNVKYLLSPWPIVTDAFVSEGMVGPVFLYRNPTVLPRAYLVGRYRYARSHDEAMAMLLSGDVDPSAETILYEHPRGFPGSVLTASRATVESYGTNEVIVRTSAEADCLLVLSDTFYPGWGAEVDGNEVPILTGNLYHRVVQLPPGEHRVKFVFRSSSIRMGLWVAVGGIVLTMLGLVVYKKRT
jgi:Bacterial membrane protein YfhO